MVGHRLKAWRERTGRSQSELAGELGCSQANIGKIERGAGRPGVSIALRLQRLSDGQFSVEDWEKPAKPQPPSMAGPVERLKAWWASEHKGVSQTEVAALLGLKQDQLSRVLEGKRSVSLDDAHRIEAATNGAVPTEAWIAHGPMLLRKAARAKRKATPKRRRDGSARALKAEQRKAG